MMRFRLFLFFFFLMSFATSQERDSLETLIATEKNAEKRADLMLELADYLSNGDTATAFKYIRSAQKIIPRNNQFLKAKADFMIGQQYFAIEIDKAQQYYQKAISGLEQLEDNRSLVLKARAWHNYASMEQYKDNSNAFISIILNKSIPLVQKAGRKDHLAQYLNDVGSEMYNRKQYERSISYFNRALEIIKNEPNTYVILQRKIEFNVNAAQSYLYLNKPEKARPYLTAAESFVTKYPENPLAAAFYLVNAKYYQIYKDFEASLLQINKGLSLKNLTPNDYFGLVYQKAYNLRNLGRPKEALAALKEVMGTKEIMSMKLNARILHNEMSNIYADIGDYKNAYHHQLETKSLSDSLLSEERNSKAALMETKFRTAEKEKQIVQKELEISNKNTYLWILGLLSLLFLSSAFFIYKNFKNKKKIAEQREINLQQKLREKEQEEELKVTKAILEGAESERERVAKDLHDGLGGMLAGVKINLSTWSNNHLEEAQYEGFHKILNQLDTSVSELRRVARNLMPESLLNFGLETALKDLCEFYMKDHLNVDFQAINLQKDLPLNLQINIYRIVQELLANAVKHSNASYILVQCSQDGDQFFITVEDNGKGLSADAGQPPKGLGLKNLQNRVNYLKGKMEIHSEANEGTAVNIEFNTNAVA